jgi:hypothetical protein
MAHPISYQGDFNFMCVHVVAPGGISIHKIVARCLCQALFNNYLWLTPASSAEFTTKATSRHIIT